MATLTEVHLLKTGETKGSILTFSAFKKAETQKYYFYSNAFTDQCF